MRQVIRRLPAKKGSLYSKLLFGAYTVFLLLATLMPMEAISSGGKGWISKISFDNGDKVVHATLFFIFTFLLFFSEFIRNRNRLVLISILIGLGIEVLQHISGLGRTFDWFDLLANAAGTLIAYFLLSKLWKTSS